jgi:hypothetical protein
VGTRSGATASAILDAPKPGLQAGRVALTSRLARARAALRRERLALALGLLTMLLYLPGLRWGLPHATSRFGANGWDVDNVAGILTLSELHNLLVQPKPDWYLAYPLLHYLILTAVYAPYLFWLGLSGGVSQPSDQFPFGLADPVGTLATLALLARLVTLLMAGGTVGLTYLAASRVWDRATGLPAAVIVALSGPMVYYGRTANLDVPTLFWMSGGVLAVAHIGRHRLTVANGALLGLCAACSTATKDQAYAAWLPLVGLLAAQSVWRHRQRLRERRVWAPLAALLVTGAVTYALGSGLALFPRRFLGHVQFVLDFERTFANVVILGNTVPATPAGQLTLLGQYGGIAAESLGLFAPLGLVGLALLGRSSRFVRLLGLMLLGYYLLALAPVRHSQYRYMLFAVLALALPAARLLVLGWRRAGLARPGVATIAVIGFGWLALQAASLTYEQVADARYAAADWLRVHARAGDELAFFGTWNQLPPLPSQLVPLQLVGASVQTRPAVDLERELLQRAPRFVAVIPDYTAEPGRPHSRFLPPELYARLASGCLGYRVAARFVTTPLVPRFYANPEIVNPPVQIFERSAAAGDSGARLSCPG